MLEIAGVKLERINPRAVVSMEGDVVPTNQGFEQGMLALADLLKATWEGFGTSQSQMTAAALSVPDMPWFSIFSGVVQARIMGAASDTQAAEQVIVAIVTSFLQGAMSSCITQPEWMAPNSPTAGLDGSMMLAQEHWSGYSDFALQMMAVGTPRGFALQMISYSRQVRSCWSPHFKEAFRLHSDLVCLMAYVAGIAAFESIQLASAMSRKIRDANQVN